MLHCPLCNGPLRASGAGFVCELQHQADVSEVHAVTDARLAEALWMAVEALDNEASMLRLIDPVSPDVVALADTAEEQARLLRGLARQHANHFDPYSKPA